MNSKAQTLASLSVCAPAGRAHRQAAVAPPTHRNRTAMPEPLSGALGGAGVLPSTPSRHQI